ncbi:hypothetical protein P5673_017624 [Acropora cervicornis]|uniref:Uncharacterized protein n=1 Tax=Acropora cervicornis TaxID=6130 RepID=A0AAD9QER9_ACRCE|nr:hypothetical protein P5673_017624 [Acropora cervicornis]
MKQFLVFTLVVFLILSFINESEAWRRRRVGRGKRNHAEETESFQTLEEALGDYIKALRHNHADQDDDNPEGRADET